MEPKSTPGPSWEGEISLGTPPGAPPEDHNDFFRLRRPPGAIWEPSGKVKKGFLLHSLFFRSRGAPGSDFGAIVGRF